MNMKNEIDNDFYCSGLYFCGGRCEAGDDGECIQEDCEFLCYRRKWPTPEQFEEEYGEVYADDSPVWCLDSMAELPLLTGWQLKTYKTAKHIQAKSGRYDFIVCACTPWQKPDIDWRP